MYVKPEVTVIGSVSELTKTTVIGPLNDLIVGQPQQPANQKRAVS